MFIHQNKFRVAVVMTGLLVLTGWLGPAAAQKASVPKVQSALALGEGQVKQLLLLMEADARGKVSKQEYMKFMEAEFQRLDKNQAGELDVKELVPPNVAAAHFAGK